MDIKSFKKLKLPQKPGVYFFLKNKEVLYVGKATSLKDRVKSYFGKGLIETRGPMLLDMVFQSTVIKWKETDSVLEALILEANLIKKYQPKYNTKEKDNKSFNYVCITDETIPKVLVERGRNLALKKLSASSIFGPFPNGQQLREAMRIIRSIFPYVDEQSSKKNNMEFYRQLGLVPSFSVFNAGRKKGSFSSWSGPSSSLVRGPEKKNLFSDRHSDYKKNIKNLKLFFEGKKKSVITNLKKEMSYFAKRREFEKAGEIKKRIFALNHINDVALIKEDVVYLPPLTKEGANSFFRIEAYDIAHMGGKNMVGVMVVMEGGELAKDKYRKFIIKTQTKANDTGALGEVISRRLCHTEWNLPNIVVVDGGVAQVGVAKKILKEFSNIKIVSVVKDDKHKAKAIMGDEKIIQKYKKDILLINSESHRFAIAYHKLKRNKSFKSSL